jgi:hypothetical protein
MTGGTGFRRNPGPGPCIIMAGGTMILSTGGYGFPAMIGRRHGLNGGWAARVWAGHRWGPLQRFGPDYTHSWVIPANHWTFVDARYIDAPYVYRHAYPVESNYRYVGRTSRAGGVVVEGERIVTRGPGRQFVEEKTGRQIRRVEMVDVQERSREGYRHAEEPIRVEVWRSGLRSDRREYGNLIGDLCRM